MTKKAVAQCDGASLGNPGPGGSGWTIEDDKGNKHSGATGHNICTNNEAEYHAVIGAMANAIDLKVTELEVRSDSELVVKQLNGEYRIRDDRMLRLAHRVWQLQRGIPVVIYRWVPRMQNREADKLSKEAAEAVRRRLTIGTEEYRAAREEQSVMSPKEAVA